MNTEFIIDINEYKATIYMQIGFFEHKDMSSPLHMHPLTEMHILLSGSAILKCDKENMALQGGEALCVPANILHTYEFYEKDCKRITFFIDCDNPSKTIKKIKLPQAIIPLLCKEIEEYILTGKDYKLKPLISYICSDFFVTETKKPFAHITNRKLLLDDFFSKRYTSKVTLDDLAKELLLSHKQTEREVKRITGNTFVGELSKRRIDAAILLLQTTNIPLTKISELVGFSSYSGFYKAYKKRLASLRKKK